MKRFFYSVATDRVNGVGPSILKAFLLFVSFLYSAGVQCILLFYKVGLLKQHHLPKPVISVGNITMGGVGKTPLVVLIAQLLRAKGLKPVILTRGYMATRGKSDEVELFQRILKDVPVLVGADRIKNAREFLKNNEADVFLLDDGFQHWCLFRDLDMVAIDATNAFGNKHAIPRGILREPLSSLKRARMFVLTKTNLADTEGIKASLQKINPRAPIVETIHQPVGLDNLRINASVDLDFIKGKDIAAFCSIGTPESFEKTLMNLGGNLSKNFPFIDHHIYTKDELESIVQYCQKKQINTIVTTEKDAVKLTDFLDVFGGIYILCLRIEINITRGKDAFLERIHNIS